MRSLEIDGEWWWWWWWQLVVVANLWIRSNICVLFSVEVPTQNGLAPLSLDRRDAVAAKWVSKTHVL
jgi:hypothetical protein